MILMGVSLIDVRSPEPHPPAPGPPQRRGNFGVSTVGEIAWATISRPVGAVSALLIVSLVLGEVYFSALRHLFTKYPLSTSFVTSFITLIFTVSVINQIITRRLQMRWERVRSIAMQGLNTELRVARDLLYIIEHGMAPFDVTLPIVAAAEDRVPTAVRALMAYEDGVRHGARLIEILVNRDEWVPFARIGIAEACAYLRESLARWSPLLSIGAEVNEASHSMILNAAYIADAVSALELPLAVARLQGGILPVRARDTFEELWEVISAAFVFVEESVSKTVRSSLELARGKPWKSAMRNRITPAACRHLKEWAVSGVAGFQHDLLVARDRLYDQQKDLIDLTKRHDVGECGIHHEEGGDHSEGI
jgi:hypothetical protein